MMDDTKPTAKKVLCIEDEYFISELYSRALVKAGYEVTIVVDGNEGLAAAMSSEYAVILLDIMIPSLLGLDILHELRTKRPDLKAKIIIATNLDQGKENRATIEQQVDAYVIKAETTPRQMVELVNSVCA